MRTIFLALALMSAVPATATPRKGDVALETYPDAQAQVRRRLEEIWANFKSKDVARQESFHLYGPKFTEFKDGQSRGDAEANKKGEKENLKSRA